MGRIAYISDAVWRVGLDDPPGSRPHLGTFMVIRSALASATCLFVVAGAAQAQSPPAPSSSAAPEAPPPAADAPAPAPSGQEVVVTGQRSALRTSIDRLSYDIGNDLQTQTGSVADALRNVPGVEVDAQGNVSLRGDGNVTVLIDGRPSGAFQGEGRGEALQQFPADRIARVEVITNPNASLSPEGVGGVINLVTKRTSTGGRTGSFRASVGTDDRYNAAISASHTGKKLTVSGDFGFRSAGGENEDSRVRARLDEGTQTFVEQRTKGTSDTTGGGFRNARLAVDYDLNPRDRLSAELSHRGFGFEAEGKERFEADAAGGGLARAYDREIDNAFDRSGTELRTGWRRRFGEASTSASAADHELVVDLTLDRTVFTRDTDSRFVNLFPVEPENVRRFNVEVVSDEAELEIEYVTPRPGEASLRVGAEFDLESNSYDNFGADGADFGSLVVDPTLTNRFEYDQTIGSLFAIYERPFGKFTVQGGLRVEQVDISIDQLTTGQSETNDYTRGYPTLFVTYDATENQRLRASYSRRIQRPSPQDLNPFLVFLDPQNFRQGNPRLEPEITDSFELGYQYRRGQTFYLATAFHRLGRDGVTDVVREIDPGVFLSTRENLSESRRSGLELVANGRLAPTLTYNVSGTLGWNEIDVRTTAFVGTRSGESVSARASLNWQPTANDFVQVNGFLNGEQLQAQGVREASGTLNLGYRRKVNERLSLVFTAQNVLDSFTEVVTLDTPTLRDRSERSFIPPGAFIGFTWTFGDVVGGQRRRQDPGFDFEQGGGPPA